MNAQIPLNNETETTNEYFYSYTYSHVLARFCSNKYRTNENTFFSVFIFIFILILWKYLASLLLLLWRSDSDLLSYSLIWIVFLCVLTQNKRNGNGKPKKKKSTRYMIIVKSWCKEPKSIKPSPQSNFNGHIKYNKNNVDLLSTFYQTTLLNKRPSP